MNEPTTPTSFQQEVNPYGDSAIMPNIPYEQFNQPAMDSQVPGNVPNPTIPERPVLSQEEMAARLERIETLLNNAVAEKESAVSLIDPANVPYDTPDFFAGLDMDKVLDSPQGLKEVLHRVYKSAVEVGTQRGVEIATANAVNLATQRSRNELTSQQALTRFYDKYPHLADKTNLVGLAIREVREKNPGLRNHDAIMSKVGELFGAPSVTYTSAADTRNTQMVNPGLVQPLGGQMRQFNQPPIQRTGSQQEQIDDFMRSLFGR